MRKLFYKLTAPILFITIALTGCQKDIDQVSSVNGEIQSDDSRAGSSKIRLANAQSEFGEDQYEYNKKGLLEKWSISTFGVFTHEYDKWGRLKKAKLFDFEGNLYNTILFFYNHKGQRYHEVWYDKDTWTIIDEGYYKFDYKGRCESFTSVLGYSVKNTWSKESNLLEWAYYENGVKSFGSKYTYNHKLKNPFSAIPGLEYAYPFTNGFFYWQKLYSTSESFYVYDADGKVIEAYPQDPSKTVAKEGPRGYVGTSDFFDEASQSYVHFVFTYEKGRSGYHFGECKSKKDKAWRKHMTRGGKKSMKEKAADFRRELAN